MDRLYAPWRMAYVDQPHPAKAQDSGCVFCDKVNAQNDIAELIVHRGAHIFVVLNLFPYNNGHIMLVPYAHYGNLGDLAAAESLELMSMTQTAISALDHAFHPQGYNIGMNLGLAAGAGIADHIHLHIVPRWVGDTNFMPVLGDTKVLPDALEASCLKIRAAWDHVTASPKVDNG